MKKLLFALLLVPCMSYALWDDIMEKNGIVHWDDDLMSVYREPSTARQAYFCKEKSAYNASLYQTSNEDTLWMNPPTLENPQAVYEELATKFSN
jgi:hypothetical protein